MKTVRKQEDSQTQEDDIRVKDPPAGKRCFTVSEWRMLCFQQKRETVWLGDRTS